MISDIISENNIDANLEEVEDIVEIMKFNIMNTPALVKDHVIKIKCRVSSKDKVLALLK